MGKRIVLADEIDKQREKATTIVGSKGQEWEIPPPQLWPDEKVAGLREAFVGDDMATIGRLLLDDQYDAYVKDGGTGALLLNIYRDAVGDLGESSASSSS